MKTFTAHAIAFCSVRPGTYFTTLDGQRCQKVHGDEARFNDVVLIRLLDR